MKSRYDFKAIDINGRNTWDDNKTFKAENDYTKPKYYPLVEFPIPRDRAFMWDTPALTPPLISWRESVVWKVITSSIPWDGTRLACPLKTMLSKIKIHPEIVTKQNVERFKGQLKSLGLSFDWDRE